MRVIISGVFVIDIDDGEQSHATAPVRNPLDELTHRLRQEMQHGRPHPRRALCLDEASAKGN